MNILITGGAGFIGSHITRLLLDTSHVVTVYDDLSSGHKELIDPRAKFIQGDLFNDEALEAGLKDQDAVIHMAARIEVSESVKDPLGFAENNILGSIHLFEAMYKANVKKIVFSSTATVYGNPKSLPIKEDAPLSAFNPYAATKISVEALLHSYRQLHGFDVTILRYFNPYGPNELHDPETHAIPNFIKAALKDRSIPLYWKGNQVRDFIYVEDLADAHIEVLNLDGFNIFNVGSETGIAVIDVVNMISKIIGKPLEINDLGERPGDVPANYASSAKLKEITGWQSKHSLEDGLNKTIEWFKSHQQPLENS